MVFAGTLIGLTNALTNVQNGQVQNQAQAANNVRLQNQAPANLLRQQNAPGSENLRMSGKVVIGQGPEMEVDAVSSSLQTSPR